MKIYLINHLHSVYALVASICFGCLILNDYLWNLIDSTAINVELFVLVADYQKFLFHLRVAVIAVYR